ncbi:3323_t:CDS:2, partial [Dentiscutata erythropus]
TGWIRALIHHCHSSTFEIPFKSSKGKYEAQKQGWDRLNQSDYGSNEGYVKLDKN